jgi:hypothetical protein
MLSIAWIPLQSTRASMIGATTAKRRNFVCVDVLESGFKNQS